MKQKLQYMHESLPDAAAVLGEGVAPPAGIWTVATVPDTLDLAWHAEAAINVLTANVLPDAGYAITQSFCFGKCPPQLGAPNWMPMKFLRSLPLMRMMCGSDANLDVERSMMAALLGQVGADGQIYYPIAGDGPPAGTSYPAMNGIAALALLAWHHRDNNAAWLPWVKRIARGLQDALIEIDDYAYIPPESSLSSDGHWHWTLRGDRRWPPGYIPYTPPAEPASDQQGFEGAVKWEQSNIIKALVQVYRTFGDEEFLVSARKLARFCLKPNLWSQYDENGHPGVEHGLWCGHLHGNLNTLQALLDLAITTSDSQLKQIVRHGYEYARMHGIIRLGWMPSWIAPQRFGRPASAAVESEGCGAADTLILAAQLSDAGLGDYWDDVDAIVRNHLIEMQITDLERMRRACGSSDYDAVLQQFVGGFTQAELTGNLRAAVYGCCTSNGACALYHAWEGAIRYDRGVATVNLFLNRASPWMDVDSYLPFTGRVVLYNKQAHTVLVRIPGWVNPHSVACFVNDVEAQASLVGNRLLIGALSPGDVIRIEFAIAEVDEQYTIGETVYTATLRGSTVVDVRPRATRENAHRDSYPFFVREHLRSTTASMRTVRRFIPTALIST